MIQKLEKISFTLEEEIDLTIVDVSGSVRAAFDVQLVTKNFYKRFKAEHSVFLSFIDGINHVGDREWYASLMLNRMMFIYFIQKRGFLDYDADYLRNRLQKIRKVGMHNRFQTFYRLFLLRLFHDGLGCPEAIRKPEIAELLGRIPYLNGGLFDVHELEEKYSEIHIPDMAFERIFEFFDAYQWHLDDRPLKDDNEINPDILGYIFEKYVNQKQMGAYYTKEDITQYISCNTIISHLLFQAERECAVAFEPYGELWRRLSDDPDRYIRYPVRHGITFDVNTGEELATKRELPREIILGLDDISNRTNWNKQACSIYGIPTETWREHVTRRLHYEEVYGKLKAGEISSINELITNNLNIEQFAQDAIAWSETPELVSAFWNALTKVSIIDPTCGSGAFLFAALNVLELLYTTCLETMRSFIEDQKYSERKNRAVPLTDFRNVLNQVSEHANEQYFILKSIIVNNLYGVDIMDEAVEICKLRLFLKIVAQLERYEQIEPLPDIDFNIRTGNTLVGFTTIQEIRDAISAEPDGQRRMAYDEDLVKQRRIEEDAVEADQAFYQFRRMQTEHAADAKSIADAKLKLKNRLGSLRTELDRYLASKFGIEQENLNSFEHWNENYQPFHWFVEFYGIMRDGGFDVIVGNPPYVEYSRIKKIYKVIGFETIDCGNLYAFVLERSYNILNHNGYLGMIVQLSICCTKRMKSIQDKCIDESSHLWLAHFDDRPAKLFDGLQHIRASIVLSQRNSRTVGHIVSTSYIRWYSVAREMIFDTLSFVGIDLHLKILEGSIPKIGHPIGSSIVQRLTTKKKLEHSFSRITNSVRVYYHNAPQYWIRATNFVPYFWNEKDGEKISSHVKILTLSTEMEALTVISVLNSSLFYWWFLTLSDCRDLNLRTISHFPLGLNEMSGNLQIQLGELSRRLMENFKQHLRRKETRYKATGKVIYDEFYQKPSKSICDEIDMILAKYYGFTDEQLDYIINYDYKYRMGSNSK